MREKPADTFFVIFFGGEVINEESGPNAESMDYLNAVRERAGLSPLAGLSQEGVREAVLDERRVELAFENHC